MQIQSENELYVLLSEKVLAGELRRFSEVAEFCETLKISFTSERTLLKIFRLIKRISWGFFRDLDREANPRMWKELVVSHPVYQRAGDLKQNISISNLYVAMLDIHGYTKFCQESKSNLTRLRMLDNFIEGGIKKIGVENSVLLQRSHGDEIIIVAARATDVLKTTFDIMDGFSDKPLLEKNPLVNGRHGHSILLPEFQITAGIAGGNTNLPLVITESGDISSFVVNMAARLQARANHVSPHDSKIIVSQSVVTNFEQENKFGQSHIYSLKVLSFINCGPIAFKGVRTVVYDFVYKPAEKYRLNYAGMLEDFHATLSARQWQGKIFIDIIMLVRTATGHHAEFQIEVENNTYKKQNLIALCDSARTAYEQNDDFPGAVRHLETIMDIIGKTPGFDRLLVDLVHVVHTAYKQVVTAYENVILKHVEKNLDTIFNAEQKTLYLNSAKYLSTHERLKAHALRSPALSHKKRIWHAVIQTNSEIMNPELYSGKK